MKTWIRLAFTLMTSKNLFSVLLPVAVAIQVLLFPDLINAQHANISFEHFTMENGLSAPVTHITQDKFGFLWFGTTDGLNRFDGNNFIVYRNIPGDSTSLLNNIINALHVDQQGRVWAATNGGLCYYDFQDDQFHSIRFNDTLETLDQHRVHGVYSGTDSSIWFATRTILHQWKDGKTVKSVSLPSSPNVLVKHLYVDKKNRLWIGSNEGLHMYDDASLRFLHGFITSPFSIENNLSATVHPIIHFDEDTIFTGSWYAGLQKVFLSGNKIKSIALTDSVETDPRRHIVSGIAPGTGSQWWVGTYGNGIAWFDSRSNKFIDHFHHNPSDANSLSSDYINYIFTDASGIVWIGTSKGLDKFDPLTQQFKSVAIPVPSNFFAVYRLVNTIVEDKEDTDWLWLCVSGVGLYHYNKNNQQYDLSQIEDENSDQLIRNNLYSFYYDHIGRVWIGTRNGIYLFNTKTKTFKLSPVPANADLKGIHTILEDKIGNFWFATHSNGIFKYNEKQNQLTSYSYNPKSTNSLPDNKVFCLMEDSQGILWIGTQNRGLCRLDPATNEFLFFQHDKSNPNSIPDNGVYDLYEDAQHQLWIATENGFAQMNLS
ncbi:MAG TPA: two-component regulator propeller domain-containing protein, partial [Saprospiraceae bacterium]|nr:two-component regulator propeller domain-containing protein [Saprospiraceae bacterium]